MSTSILVPIDPDTKARFKEQAKREGVSMGFLVKNFIETYTDTPIDRGVPFTDEEDAIMDQAWKTPEALASMTALSKMLSEK